MIPVLINEAIVRGFYLIRRTHREIVEKDIKSIRDLNKIDTQKILPINNPAIRRMCTLSSGVFCAVDIIDALIRAIIEQNPGTFFLRLNYVGIARFIVAIGAEASAFLKETQEDRKRSSYRRYREEQEIAGLKWFALDADQTQILLSLQKQLCLYDISHTQEKSKREKKEQWLNTWIHGMEQSIGVISEAEDQFILDEAQIYEKLEQIKETATKESLYLIALEAMTFIPYFPLEEKDVAKYKGIKQDVSYLDKVFYNKQSVIKKKTAEEIRSCYRWYYDLFSGRIRNRWIIGIGTVAITAITAGLAFHFAPAIAVALAGKAGLSGAALTSYSLAAIGGGSLAAGGLGMAGGTMIIAGGGAMLGVLGGAGLSSMTSMMLLESDGYVLNECSKLLGFTEKILLKEEYAFSSISELECVLNSRIETLGELLKETKEEVSQIKEQNQKKKKEERIKTAEKSLWYLSETAKHLKELRNRIPQKQEKAVPQEHTTSMLISPTTETK